LLPPTNGRLAALQWALADGCPCDGIIRVGPKIQAMKNSARFGIFVPVTRVEIANARTQVFLIFQFNSTIFLGNLNIFSRLLVAGRLFLNFDRFPVSIRTIIIHWKC
jgi:hypothetical protein